MKIYFAGSIRGGREDASHYRQLIALLAEYGEVLTEHVGNAQMADDGDRGLSDAAIYARDTAWLAEADVLVAEVTTPSHGVGYEIARAEASGKPVLCLQRRSANRRLSAMLAGNPNLRIAAYENVEELRPALERFLHQ